MKSLKILTLAALAAASALVTRADETRHFQAALWAPDYQLVPANQDITGLRIEIYGENKNVTGLEFGLVNITTGDFTGFTGYFPTIYNGVHGITKGVQFGIINNTKGEVIGWQGGWVDVNQASVTGLQTAIVNWNAIDAADVTGVQLGIVNTGKHVTGLQLGIVNYAETLKGLQLGLWNQVNSRDWDEFKPLPKVFPFINIGF